MLNRPLSLTIHIGLAGLAAISIAACGSSSKAGSSTTRTTPAPPHTTASLAKPLLATCLVNKPVVSRISQNAGRGQQLAGWKVVYHLVATVTSLTETGEVVLLENPPVLPAGFVKGGHFLSVAGHRVSLLVRRGPGYGFLARWKTRSALYVALATGRQTSVLEHVIACMP